MSKLKKRTGHLVSPEDNRKEGNDVQSQYSTLFQIVKQWVSKNVEGTWIEVVMPARPIIEETEDLPENIPNRLPLQAPPKMTKRI